MTKRHGGGLGRVKVAHGPGTMARHLEAGPSDRGHDRGGIALACSTKIAQCFLKYAKQTGAEQDPMRQPSLPNRISRLARAGALLALAWMAAMASGCAMIRPIPGTKIPDTPTNREVLARVEEYRVALEQRDATKLLTMASPQYYEDAGTPSGADDYGYPGLKRVLEQRLSALRWLRYLIRFRDLRVEGNRAMVDIKYDISFQLLTELGERWERKQSEKRMELVKEDNRWMFLSGM